MFCGDGGLNKPRTVTSAPHRAARSRTELLHRSHKRFRPEGARPFILLQMGKDPEVVAVSENVTKWWTLESSEEVFDSAQTSIAGLTEDVARVRRETFGLNMMSTRSKRTLWDMIWDQVSARSPAVARVMR